MCISPVDDDHQGIGEAFVIRVRAHNDVNLFKILYHKHPYFRKRLATHVSDALRLPVYYHISVSLSPDNELHFEYQKARHTTTEMVFTFL